MLQWLASLLALFLTSTSLSAQAPPWEWVKDFGGSQGMDYFEDLAVDSAGNLIAGGGYRGQATFGGTALTAPGTEACFITKYDSMGNQVWLRTGTTNNSSARVQAVATDESTSPPACAHAPKRECSFAA